ncbi:fungal hydrophobin [Trametes meyenii]|nr:fungal hydrophobin [Trametes meyenii]
MVAKLAATFTTVSALAILAVATPAPQAGAGTGSCTTGTLQCCEQVQTADSLGISTLLAAIGVVLQDLDIPIGVGCSGITGVGVGSSDACSANAVCCDDTTTGGLLSIGCLPAAL